jgi:hypothetical protein
MQRASHFAATAALVGFFAFSAALTSAQAQSISPQCPPGAMVGPIPDVTKGTQDACQKAIDLFKFITPQLGAAIAGGNSTLGQGGTLGGLGKIQVSARANILKGSLPQIDDIQPDVNGAVQSNYSIESQPIGLPQVDAAVGLFRGVSLGLSRVGGLDLLVSGAYLPSVSSGSTSIDLPDGSFKLGFGGRLGILEETSVIPGVSVSYLRRALPTVNIRATSSGDSLRIDELALKTDSWRLVANKRVFILGFAAGVGRDTYSSDGDISAYVAPRTGFAGGSSNTVNLDQKVSRTNIFADVMINLPFLKIIGEVGQVSGGTINTYNTFSGERADDSRTYGSFGLRFGL